MIQHQSIDSTGLMAPQHVPAKTQKQRLENAVSAGIAYVEALGYAHKTGSRPEIKRAVLNLEDWATKAAEELPDAFG